MRSPRVFLSCVLSLAFGGCMAGNNANPPGGATAPTITSQPSNQSVVVGSTATFTVAAIGTAPLSYQWQRNNSNIGGATSSSYTTPLTTAADNGATFKVVVSNSAGSATSNSATLTVNPAPPPGSATVLTYHNDNARSGLNPNETILTTTNVKTATFGKLGSLAVTGLVDAEPLYVPNLTINAAKHNVVFVATEHDLVYAFDADIPGAPLWSTSVLITGETTVSTSDVNCGQVSPEIGITSTPVIDPAPTAARPNGAIFVVAMSKNGSSFFQRLHALDLTTGAEIGTPTTITATFQKPGQPAGQVVTFDPKQYKERAALLLQQGVIYTSWASHCDNAPYTGWIMSFSEATLSPISVLNVTPNGQQGAIWMSGGGPAADSSGNIYLLDANGSFEPSTIGANGFPANGDYGNAFLKLSSSLSVTDYFNMHNTVNESAADWDFGSGGAVVLVDITDNLGTVHHLAVGAGKDSLIYVVDRDNMGKFNATADNIYQEVSGAFNCNASADSCVYSTPAFFSGTLYYGAVGDTLKAFPFQNAKLVSPASFQSPTAFGFPGTTPSISSNGTSNGIVWAIENGSTGTLHAYDATNLKSELYNSNQASGGRDRFPTNSSCKFVTPMIANGKVYVGTPGAVIVFGLLP